MPADFKLAILLPLLKKLGLQLILPNYRPISNLPFVSKVVERSVSFQLVDHLKSDGLFEIFQSAYTEGRSPETALLKVQNDILMGMENQCVTALMLLDLSAAFDTVDHQILLTRLEQRVGITGKALEWIRSYLHDRRQMVKIKNCTSDTHILECGVPQGSVLGPILFIIYILPLGDIIRSHNLMFHLFADDGQLYLTFRPQTVHENISKMEECYCDIDKFMLLNRLKNNSDKTEFTLLGTPQQCAKIESVHIKVGSSVIQPKPEVRNLGVIFDQGMTLKSHVAATSKAAYHQLYNIQMIRESLTEKAAATAIHAFVTSRLDSANALLTGLPKYVTYSLQKVQNSAARILTRTRRRDHITPVLRDLHWLPIRRRVEYKTLVITYKALNGLGPKYLADLLSPRKINRTLRSTQDTYLLHEPTTSLTSGGDRAFQKVAPCLWNKLPQAIRSKSSVQAFKNALKAHLFACEFEGK